MIEVRRSTEADVQEFAIWRYDPPYDAYNLNDDLEETVEYFLRPETNCHILHEDDVVVGFFTLGGDAQVPGGDYEIDAVDIGLGIRPDRTGAGEGSRFVDTVVTYVIAASSPPLLRVTIAAGNARALRVWTRAGFSETSRFSAANELMGSTDFVILTLARGDRP